MSMNVIIFCWSGEHSSSSGSSSSSKSLSVTTCPHTSTWLKVSCCIIHNTRNFWFQRTKRENTTAFFVECYYFLLKYVLHSNIKTWMLLFFCWNVEHIVEGTYCQTSDLIWRIIWPHTDNNSKNGLVMKNNGNS